MSINYSQAAPTKITVHPEPQAQRNVPNFQKATREIEGEGVWGGDGFGFDDFIDMINPLQHIPIVSSIYRAVTGDEIAPGARMVGGALLGGVVGMAASAANVMFEQATGKDIGENVLALFDGDAPVSARPTQHISQNQPNTLPSTSARQVLKPQAALGGGPEEATMLEPLDFSALSVPAPLPETQHDDELDQSQAILELFSAKAAGVYEGVKQAQANEYILNVAKDMKA